MSFIRKPSAGGDVTGPAASINNEIAIFDQATGKFLKQSGVFVDPATGNVSQAGDVHIFPEKSLIATNNGTPGGIFQGGIKFKTGGNIDFTALTQLAMTLRSVDAIIQHTQDAVSLSIAAFKVQGGAVIIKKLRVGGDGIFSKNLEVAGVIKRSNSGVINVVAANGITAVDKEILRIQSSTAGDSNITSNPQIVAGFEGQKINFIGQDNTKTVTFDDGDGLSMQGGVSFTVGDGDILGFIRERSVWRECYRSNNL